MQANTQSTSANPQGSNTQTTRIFWAMNRDTKRVCIMHGFGCFEEVQGAARIGIMMPDGNSANGIGRSKSLADFLARCQRSKFLLLVDDTFPYKLEIEVNGERSKVSPSVWRSWTGKRFVEGREVAGQRFYFLSEQVAV